MPQDNVAAQFLRQGVTAWVAQETRLRDARCQTLGAMRIRKEHAMKLAAKALAAALVVTSISSAVSTAEASPFGWRGRGWGLGLGFGIAAAAITTAAIASSGP